jgi:hypothetical protein
MKHLVLASFVALLGFPGFSAAENAGADPRRIKGLEFEVPPQFLNVKKKAPVNLADAEVVPAAGVPVVRMIYLVPSDRTPNNLYRRKMELAIRELQAFYRSQLGGKTFSLHDPVVEVVPTPHPVSFYTSDAPASSDDQRFWESVTSDGFDLLHGGFDDPENRWIFYIDADPLCGQVVGGTSGVAVLPANDLRGLACQPNRPVCSGEPPDTGGFCRWVGGLGHELGHSFHLEHPVPGMCPAPDRNCDHALMFLGYRTFPNAYLLPADRHSLLTSPTTKNFFRALRPRPVAACGRGCPPRADGGE